MKYLKPLYTGYDVAPLRAALEAHPELWNSWKIRTESKLSPHREVDDITVRYSPTPEVDGPHTSVWWPAYQALGGAVQPLVDRLMQETGADELGGVLITRIPSGKEVYPHVDSGWHATHYDKYCVQIIGGKNQYFCYTDCKHVSEDGDVFKFQNNVAHWVKNESNHSRISMIVCMTGGY